MNFWSMLTILFIGLKLGGVITWSWYWVLSPITVPLTLFVGLAIIGLFGGLLK